MTSIAFLGGTGPEGLGLALRMALAGHEVTIGSRSVERAEEAAETLKPTVMAGARTVRGAVNDKAAAAAEIVVNTLPYSAQAASLPGLAGEIGSKIFISTVVPLEVDKAGARMVDVPEGSAAEQARALLPAARVTGAFQTLSAVHLNQADLPIDADVLVTGDDKDARQEVVELARCIAGVRAVDLGVLARSRLVESITPLLINLNRRYKSHTEFKIVGLDGGPDSASV